MPQKGTLFSGTITSNIRYGNQEATDEQVRQFAQTAQATEFIEEKPEGYDSRSPRAAAMYPAAKSSG